MKRVFEEALRAMESGRASALVLLTKKEGSSARDPGAMMLVLEDGSTVDTVGGGILEERLKEEALNAIRDGKTRNISFALDETSKGDLNLYCGGKVEFAVIPLYPQEKLYIFGGGHISRALVRIAGPLGFRITVIDDREEFARKESYPGAFKVLHADYSEFARNLEADNWTYVVIATENHENDFRALIELIEKPFVYIGMLGSKRKLETFKKRMNEKQIKLLERLSNPIGLDIGAETPEEIAVSIAAELVKTRRSRYGS